MFLACRGIEPEVNPGGTWLLDFSEISELLNEVFVPAFDCYSWNDYMNVLDEEKEKILDRLREMTETRSERLYSEEI